MRYISSPDFHRDGAERIGILLVNSGTPASAEPADVRKFLAGLLGDPRVVELPRLVWLPILYGLILPFRPRRSARKYRKIWSSSGAPLLDLSEKLRTELTTTLAQKMLAPLSIELGMLYGGDPTVPQALSRLRESGAQRILVVPMFPQYCGATTGAVYDQVNKELRRWRWLPELRYVAEYHDYPGYIDALRSSVQQDHEARGKSQHLLMSFHGIPERFFHKGDPYFCKCQKTARLLADELMLRDDEWSVSFQSRFGPDGWLKPYTSTVLDEMPGRGIRHVAVICPGFAVDCLETLEEIEMENRDRFIHAGGEQFRYIPALNDRIVHARFLADLIAQHCQGWTQVELGLRPAGAARGASA
jgi:ferrochelatase